MSEKIEWHPNGTPGPWEVGNSADNEIMCVDARDADGGFVEVCEVWGEVDDKTVTITSETNARAIAEVPAMVDVLRRFVAVGVYRNNQIGIDARAILARIDEVPSHA